MDYTALYGLLWTKLQGISATNVLQGTLVSFAFQHRIFSCSHTTCGLAETFCKTHLERRLIPPTACTFSQRQKQRAHASDLRSSVSVLLLLFWCNACPKNLWLREIHADTTRHLNTPRHPCTKTHISFRQHKELHDWPFQFDAVLAHGGKRARSTLHHDDSSPRHGCVSLLNSTLDSVPVLSKNSLDHWRSEALPAHLTFNGSRALWSQCVHRLSCFVSFRGNISLFPEVSALSYERGARVLDSRRYFETLTSGLWSLMQATHWSMLHPEAFWREKWLRNH